MLSVSLHDTPVPNTGLPAPYDSDEIATVSTEEALDLTAADGKLTTARVTTTQAVYVAIGKGATPSTSGVRTHMLANTFQDFKLTPGDRIAVLVVS